MSFIKLIASKISCSFEIMHGLTKKPYAILFQTFVVYVSMLQKKLLQTWELESAHNYQLRVSAGHTSGHGIARSSSEGLTRLHSRCWPGLALNWRLSQGRICFPIPFGSNEFHVALGVLAACSYTTSKGERTSVEPVSQQYSHITSYNHENDVPFHLPYSVVQEQVMGLVYT